MPVTQVGIVYYADDPDKKVFRVVTPTEDDSELDRPDPVYGAWDTFGVDPARSAVLERVPVGDPRAAISGGISDPRTQAGVPLTAAVPQQPAPDVAPA